MNLSPSFCAVFLLFLICLPTACLSTVVDTRGPIVNPGMKARVNTKGVEAIDYHFLNDGAKKTFWEAQWIWLNKSKYSNQQPFMALFRKEINLSESPTSVRAWMSADVRYRLWINGQLASRGPADIGRDYNGTPTGQWLCDCRYLTPYFQKGKNIISAEVISKILTENETTNGHPGFLFEADIQCPNESSVIVKSDDSWRAIPGDYLGMANWTIASTNQHSGGLRFDAKLEPAGWQLRSFDDSAWSECSVIENHWKSIVASEIPPSMEVRYPSLAAIRITGGIDCPVKPFQHGQPIKITGNGAFTIRYDRVISAFIGLKVKGSAGAAITIMPNEMNTSGFHRTARMELRDGLQFFETPFFDSFSVINIEVSGVTTPFEIKDISAEFTSQPLTYKGSFACSDPELNKIWESCRWATQICLQTHHLDSPHHQEPISDPGDYLIEDLANFYTFGDPWLARQDLRKFAHILQQCNYRNFHTSYALLWLQTLINYYDYTGDRELVKELAPTVKGLLSAWDTFKGRNGLISEAPNYMFMDWVEIAGFACHHPPAVIGQGYISAFYYRALQDASEVAEICGDSSEVMQYKLKREALKTAFNRELWDEGRGLYRDGRPFQTSIAPSQWLPADKDIETFSPHVNTLAVLYDLAPANLQGEIMERVVNQKPLNCQPYFMHFVFDAIRHAGLFEKYGTAQMRRWKIVEATKTFREMWDTGDLSHGWIASPLIQMSSVILGVKPASPGFDKVLIAPQFCDLDWARGTIPTPHGNIDVNWSRTGKSIQLELTSPSSCISQIELPVKQFLNPTIKWNKKIIWNDGRAANLKTSGINPIRQGEVVSLTIPGGKSIFSISEK